MNLNQTFITAPGTIMHYDCIQLVLHLHTFDFFNKSFQNIVNEEWMCMLEEVDKLHHWPVA